MGRPELPIDQGMCQIYDMPKWNFGLLYFLFLFIPGQMELLATAPLHLINVL
jgi:hypothetical protein